MHLAPRKAPHLCNRSSARPSIALRQAVAISRPVLPIIQTPTLATSFPSRPTAPVKISIAHYATKLRQRSPTPRPTMPKQQQQQPQQDNMSPPNFTKDEMNAKFTSLGKAIGVKFRQGEPVDLAAMLKAEQLRYTTRTVNGIIMYWSHTRLESRLSNCEKLLEIAAADGLKPDAWTYAKLISVAGSMGRFDKLRTFVAEMREKNIPFDAVTYNHAIALFAPQHQAEAYDLYQEMLSNNFVPLASTYGLLLKSFRSNDAVFEGLVDDMRRLGVKPDGAGLNTILLYFGNLPGGYNKAKKLFQENPAEVPDTRTYTTMISIAVANNRSRYARELVHEMRQKNMRLDEFAAHAVLNLLAADGDVEAAEKHLDDMKRSQVPLGIVTLRTMMKAYATAGDSRKAMGYLREILATPEGVAQLKEDNTVFHLLLKCFLKAKDLDHTMQLYDTFNDLGRAADHGVWRYFVEIPLRCENPLLALQMWRRMQKAGFELEDPLLSEVTNLAESNQQAQ